MHIGKSLIVLLIFVTLCFLSVRLVIKQVFYTPTTKGILLTSIICLITFVSILCYKDYLYPFERAVNFTLFASLDIPEENSLSGPGCKFWHAAYEEYGVYSESVYFNPEEKVSHLGFIWPQMDFDNHTYIITYGQKLLSLSYNVWDTIECPISTGAKVGHATLSNAFNPNKVYVYEIAKIRIDNDP